jgi:hypothetical protein
MAHKFAGKFKEKAKTLPVGTQIRYIGSTKRLAARTGALYGFVYLSKTATDTYPIVLVCRPAGKMSNFRYTKEGNRYMQGVNVNYLLSFAPTALALIIEKFGNLRSVSYRTLKNLQPVVASYFRTYDVRKVRDLYLVDISKYIEETQLS